MHVDSIKRLVRVKHVCVFCVRSVGDTVSRRGYIHCGIS